MYLPCVTMTPGPSAVSGGHVHVRQGAAVSEQARDGQGHRMSGSSCSSLPPSVYTFLTCIFCICCPSII